MGLVFTLLVLGSFLGGFGTRRGWHGFILIILDDVLNNQRDATV